ncbi:hypothetical protein FSP39_009285 [Pinctada imbricata]|uniref:Cytochrome P450 n=1 Tax=Pinctada imbricata TaxID=66713 RepID=A0AA89BZ83_PINIB|nr:hypothetical protein FSP39_009285 [Pinctada imbricata]
MVAVTVYLGVLAVVLVCAYFKFLFRRRKSCEPPIPSGHWLWGNGKQFAEHAVNFLHETQRKVGDIFTIRLFHQHLTVINDVHTFEKFVKEKNFDFDAIQKQVNHNVFSFALVDARKMLKEAGKTVKGPHLVKGMQQYAQHLNQAYVDVNSRKDNICSKMVAEGEHEWRTDGLRAFNAKTLFSALFYTIFGKDQTAEHFEPNVVFKHFRLISQILQLPLAGNARQYVPQCCQSTQRLVQTALFLRTSCTGGRFRIYSFRH